MRGDERSVPICLWRLRAGAEPGIGAPDCPFTRWRWQGDVVSAILPLMSDLPSGTVTFLFTDVEGSTRLLHELGAERYAGALAEHRRVLRRASAAQGGVEVDTQGDAFFFVFPTAPGALAAASAAADRLAGGPIRVRMAIHSGTPFLTDEGYVGVDVHRAARIAACGHGRQILLSAAASGLVNGADLLDLGEHRLKDLGARACLPGRPGAVSATSELVPDELAGAGDAVSGSRA